MHGHQSKLLALFVLGAIKAESIGSSSDDSSYAGTASSHAASANRTTGLLSFSVSWLWHAYSFSQESREILNTSSRGLIGCV
ncbi:MAG TPA: hypothetical protein VF043_23095 [Ktedonobacteraceae bacterium]